MRAKKLKKDKGSLSVKSLGRKRRKLRRKERNQEKRRLGDLLQSTCDGLSNHATQNLASAESYIRSTVLSQSNNTVKDCIESKSGLVSRIVTFDSAADGSAKLTHNAVLPHQSSILKAPGPFGRIVTFDLDDDGSAKLAHNAVLPHPSSILKAPSHTIHAVQSVLQSNSALPSGGGSVLQSNSALPIGGRSVLQSNSALPSGGGSVLQSNSISGPEQNELPEVEGSVSLKALGKKRRIQRLRKRHKERKRLQALTQATHDGQNTGLELTSSDGNTQSSTASQSHNNVKSIMKHESRPVPKNMRKVTFDLPVDCSSAKSAHNTVIQHSSSSLKSSSRTCHPTMLQSKSRAPFVFQSTLTLHSGGGSVSQTNSALPCGGGSVLQSNSALPCGGGSVLQSSPALPSGGGSVLQSNSALPCGGGSVLQSNPALPSGGGSVLQSSSIPGPEQYVAVDCEMVGVGKGKLGALARCSIVDYDGHIVLDLYVKPDQPITDYRTRWSGIRPRDMYRAIPFKNALNMIKKQLQSKIVVGHAIMNDFKAMLYFHPWPNVRDTSHYKQLRHMANFDPDTPVSLKRLTLALCGYGIQRGQHCSVEDARATMSLFKLVRLDWEQTLLAKPPISQPITEQHGTRQRHTSRSVSESSDESYLNDHYWPQDDER